jgi:putative ABC transport system ATP-binding protein
MEKLSKNRLEIKDLRHVYDDGQNAVEVLRGVNARFEGGQMYAIVGESGSGKTTLISLAAALDRVQKGSIKFNGQTIQEIGEATFRRRHVGIVFQAFNLIKYMTARENVEVALDFAGTAHGSEKTRAYEVLQSVGISHAKANRLVGKLSGGEQQRVAVARAMAGDTPIVVADEPTGNLDEKTEAKILALFRALADDGKIVIIVTHSQKVARHADAVVYRMVGGKLRPAFG